MRHLGPSDRKCLRTKKYYLKLNLLQSVCRIFNKVGLLNVLFICCVLSFRDFYSGREGPSLGFGSVLRVRVANISACVTILWNAWQRLWRSNFFLCPLVVLFRLFCPHFIYVHAIYAHIGAFRVTIDKSGCTFKHEFGSCGTGIYELGRVDVLWLFHSLRKQTPFLPLGLRPPNERKRASAI